MFINLPNANVRFYNSLMFFFKAVQAKKQLRIFILKTVPMRERFCHTVNEPFHQKDLQVITKTEP